MINSISLGFWMGLLSLVSQEETLTIVGVWSISITVLYCVFIWYINDLFPLFYNNRDMAVWKCHNKSYTADMY